MPSYIPTPALTWDTTYVNQAVASGTADSESKIAFLAIVTALVSFVNNPCTAKGSSDATTAAMDGTNRWTATSKLTWNSTTHSWIVLEFPGINDGAGHKLNLCIDLNSGSNNGTTFVVSAKAGFTGGTTSARPTATDEQVLITQSTSYGAMTTANAGRVHIMHSTDGSVTHVVMCNQNVAIGWWCFAAATPSASLAGGTWDYPWIAIVDGQASAGVLGVTGAKLSSTGSQHSSRHSATAISCSLQWEGGASNTTTTGAGNTTNGITGNITDLGFGLWGGSGVVGRLGYIKDMFIVGDTVMGGVGNTMGADASHRQWAAFGVALLPWTNDSTVPLGS